MDQTRVQQVVINLLSNAIKFSDSASIIYVRVQTTACSTQENLEIIISVTDTGLGMSDEDIKNLLTPFLRTKDQQSRDRNKNGHGLGLSIC
jgi:signal transduction histidine kinase